MSPIVTAYLLVLGIGLALLALFAVLGFLWDRRR